MTGTEVPTDPRPVFEIKAPASDEVVALLAVLLLTCNAPGAGAIVQGGKSGWQCAVQRLRRPLPTNWRHSALPN